MNYAYAKELDSKKIPIIDIASLRDGSNKISVAKKLHQANKNLGFLYISNHGISKKPVVGLEFGRYSSTRNLFSSIYLGRTLFVIIS